MDPVWIPLSPTPGSVDLSSDPLYPIQGYLLGGNNRDTYNVHVFIRAHPTSDPLQIHGSGMDPTELIPRIHAGSIQLDCGSLVPVPDPRIIKTTTMYMYLVECN